jgi:exonuclease 3'-5' domain-containing protein 1
MRKLEWISNTIIYLSCTQLSHISGGFSFLPESLAVEEVPQEEVLAVVDVPYGKMGRIIGKKGSSILYIKQSCRADIFIGGARGPPDKIFVIGAMKEVRKAEAILRGRFL